MPLHPRTCSILYSVSCLLDALDGYAARYFEQSTRFGALLDMVTDRCTTACLLVFLASAFPRYSILFQGLISLDLASHYMHMYATLVVSGTDSSHKNIDKSQSFILNLYYTNKVGLSFQPPTASILIENRSSCLSSAPSTSSSSSPSTSSLSPRLSSRLTLSRALRRPLALGSIPASRSTPRFFDKSSPTLSALLPWNSLVRTRWTRLFPGFSLQSASRSWLASRLSTLFRWSRPASNWPCST